jgi:AcrR family transcriptional regulator
MKERNTADSEVTGEGDAILDAARATVLDFGVRRATLTEVARRAGVSRMTVYRRYEDGLRLIRALMTREFGAVVVEAAEVAAREPDGRSRVAAAAAGTVERLLGHPLLLRILELEPELLVPYLTARLGEFQRQGLAQLTGAVAAGQADGSIRAGDPAVLAATIERFGRGPVLAALTYGPDERAAVVAEFRWAVAAYLAA